LDFEASRIETHKLEDRIGFEAMGMRGKSLLCNEHGEAGTTISEHFQQ